MQVTEVLPVKALLGEGALWNNETGELYWVDIEDRTLYIYKPADGNNRSIKLPSRIGTVVPVNDGSVLVALEDGIYQLNVSDASLKKVSDPEPDKPDNRFNDGKCDPAGRFWAGTMSTAGKSKNGALYRLDHHFNVKKMIDGVTTSNGIVWSLDKTKMYYIDTRTRKVVRYDFHNLSGEISNPVDSIIIPDSLGKPDGSTIDSEGMIWIAMWGGSCITRWDPVSGKLLERIGIPALNVTSCAFGNKNLDVLYITTASINMGDRQGEFPHAGKLFSVAPGVKGLPANQFLLK